MSIIIPVLIGCKTTNTHHDAPCVCLDPWFPLICLDPWDPYPSSGLSLDIVQVDWKETPSAHVFKADLPGLKKDEVKVEVEEQRFLKISGERSKEAEEKDVHRWHRVGRSFGKFLGSIALPEDAVVGRTKAVLENGVLTVTVPKEKGKKLQARVIEIGIRFY